MRLTPKRFDCLVFTAIVRPIFYHARAACCASMDNIILSYNLIVLRSARGLHTLPALWVSSGHLQCW